MFEMPILADSIIVSEGANTMDIGRTMLLNRLPRHRLDAGNGTFLNGGLGFLTLEIVYFFVD